MPLYCLFGDTVNTASRMESHGVPDHIHLSPFTYSVLKHKLIFEIAERGEIEVKGKGLMQTYFLLKNLQKSDEQIMGLVDGETCVYLEDLEDVMDVQNEVRPEGTDGGHKEEENKEEEALQETVGDFYFVDTDLLSGKGKSLYRFPLLLGQPGFICTCWLPRW